MKDKERKNRPLVKSLLKSPKQIAKDKWIDLKQSTEIVFNEMSNSVSCSVDQLKEELVNQINAELDFIKNFINPSLQEVSYKCNKAFRLYNQYKYSSKESKKAFIKSIWKEVFEYGEELGNAFIMFLTYEVIEPMKEMFKDLWTCGMETWAECKNNWESLIDFLNGLDEINLKDKTKFNFNQAVNEIIPFLNNMLPVILSLAALMTNYIINKGGCKDIGSKITEKLEKDNLLYMNVPEKEVDSVLKDEGIDQTVAPIYEDSPDPSTFKFPIGDSKLYPYMKKDVYDLSLGCWIEPSQLLRVVREDQFRIKSPDFISRNNDSSSSYDQYEDEKESVDSLCYIIPPSKRDSNDIIENEDDNNGSGNCLHAIIEFDDDCCAVPAEPYSWKCLPGEWVYQDKVLAECKQYDMMLPVKSIFQSGVIRKDPCTGDFGRIRKDVCNRHIIIDCFDDGTKGVLDASIFEKLIEDFKKEQCMYRLFYEYMPYSILPNIISGKKYYKVPTKFRLNGLTPSWIENNGMPEAYNDIYLPYVEHYEKTIENFKHEMQEIDSEKRIKATNGEYDKLNALMDETLEARRKFVWGIHNWVEEKHGIIDLYVSYKDNLHKSKCFNDYRDARGLGETYYTDLIAMLSFTEHDKCILDYYELLEDIIYKRELIEGYDWFMLKRKICGELAAISDLEWSDLEKVYKGPNDFNAIFSLVASHTYEKLKNKERRIYPVVNLYMLYKRKMNRVHYHEYAYGVETSKFSSLFHGYDHLKEDFQWNVKSSGHSNKEMLNLVKEEKTRLEEFFKKKRLAYQEITLEKLIQRTKELDELQAEWPPYTEIFVDGIQYRLYKFANIDVWLRKNSQKKGGDNSLANPGDIDPYSWIYTEPSDEKIKGEVDANSGGLGDATEKVLNGDPDGNIPLISDDVDDKFCPMMEVPITGIKYWKRYCGVATLATIPFLATGFVLLGVPIPFPAIYIPLVVVNGDVLMVIGIGNRGITFFPMVIYVNANHDYSTALVPILIALKAVRDSFQKQLSKLELTIPNVADLMIDQLEGNNANLLNQNKQIEKEIANLKTKFKPSWAHVQKELKKYLGLDERQKVTRLE